MASLETNPSKILGVSIGDVGVRLGTYIPRSGTSNPSLPSLTSPHLPSLIPQPPISSALPPPYVSCSLMNHNQCDTHMQRNTIIYSTKHANYDRRSHAVP